MKIPEDIPACFKDTSALGVRDLVRLGFPRWQVLYAAKTGRLQRIARGLYSLPDTEPTEAYALAVVSRKAPHAAVCQTTGAILHFACSRKTSPPRSGAAPLARLRRAWRPDEDGRWPRPAELARRTGLQKDYLNRLARRACGLTLGQWRDRELLRAAEADLKRGNHVAAVSGALGFSDPSYFARWFRKQTGLPPSHWQPA